MEPMERKIKVKATSGYHYKKVPTIQLKGSYLESFGFSIETPLTITITSDRIVIVPAPTETQ